ncbi:MAG TPA: hypothetical protein VFO39_04580 [Candidatus Sulfotelmatobacter sp.]|nr:hypothetical protein [Candidatus Sulfotelmatobacter sp.]
MKVNLVSLVAVFLLAVSLSTVSAQTKTEGLKSVEYKTGQVWTTNQNISVTILAVEDVHRVGRVVHVRVDKIPWQSCGDIHLTRAIEHLAVTEKMMLKSALVLTKDNADLPESSVEAYRKWQTQKKREIAKVPLQKAISDEGIVPPMICNFVPSQT